MTSNAVRPEIMPAPETPEPYVDEARFPPPRPFAATHRRGGLSFSGRPLCPRRAARRLAMAAAIMAVVVAVASCVLFTAMRAQAYDTQERAARDGQTSTPASAWALGEVPMLLQTDPAWAGLPYAGSDIKTAGCGPTCLAMAYIALTGSRDMSPADMALFSESGGYVESGMTAWRLMSEGAERLGLASEELPADQDALAAALDAGCVVIASVAPGDFTTTGHFIVIAGRNADGSLSVRDPNSAQRSAQAWDPQRVLGQCANLWALHA